MNIGIDIRALATPKTGVGEYTTELLRAVFALDQTNKYFLFYNGFRKNKTNKLLQELSKIFNQPNVHFITTRWPNKLLNLGTLLFGRPHLDVILSAAKNLHFSQAQKNTKLDYFFSPNLNFTALNANVKHILMIHDLAFYLFPEYNTLRQRLWHRLLKPREQAHRADRIITPSENTKRDLIDYFNIAPEKISVLSPGLPSLFSNVAASDVTKSNVILSAAKNLPFDLPSRYILFLGTIEPRKNIFALVRAFESAAPRLPLPYHLVIAGASGWNNTKLFNAIKKSPLADRIHMLNYIAETDKPELLRRASLFVYPSFYEGFGFPVLEAMSVGTPVITSNRSSLPEVTGDAAYLINPHHPEEIAEGIIALLTNQALREEKIKKGLEQTTRFNWHTAAEQWLELLK